MSAVLTPRQTQQGWIIDMPIEMTTAMGVPEGSMIILYTKPGNLTAEIMPPLSPELADIADQIFEENQEFYKELKHLGD